MYDISQPIDRTEAILCKASIGEIRDRLRSIGKRVNGLHLDDAYDAIDDALTYLSDADDAMQRALDDPRGLAA